MNELTVMVVAGLSGAGKTTWIQKQLSRINLTTNSHPSKALYFSPGVGNTPIDQKRLASEFSFVQVFVDGQELEFLNHLESANVAFIEQGFYLELNASAKILHNMPHRKIAVLPENLTDSDYHTWADEVINGTSIETDPSQLWRVPLTGQVIDEDSLREFWYEMTQGAYGQIARIKGIFDVGDGRSLYGDFVLGVPTNNFTELDLPRHLSGRPERFSGLEVVGKDFDQTALKETLEDCCFSDAMLGHYQQQVQQYLTESAQV